MPSRIPPTLLQKSQSSSSPVQISHLHSANSDSLRFHEIYPPLSRSKSPALQIHHRGDKTPITPCIFLHGHHHPPHPFPVGPTGTPLVHSFGEHPQLHGHIVNAIMFLNGRFIDFALEIAPVIAHPEVFAFFQLLRVPPRRQEIGPCGCKLDEFAERRNAVWRAGVDATLVHLLVDGSTVFLPHPESIDEELVDVLLGPIVQPGVSVEAREGLRDVLL